MAGLCGDGAGAGGAQAEPPNNGADGKVEAELGNAAEPRGQPPGWRVGGEDTAPDRPDCDGKVAAGHEE